MKKKKKIFFGVLICVLCIISSIYLLQGCRKDVGVLIISPEKVLKTELSISVVDENNQSVNQYKVTLLDENKQILIESEVSNEVYSTSQYLSLLKYIEISKEGFLSSINELSFIVKEGDLLDYEFQIVKKAASVQITTEGGEINSLINNDNTKLLFLPNSVGQTTEVSFTVVPNRLDMELQEFENSPKMGEFIITSSHPINNVKLKIPEENITTSTFSFLKDPDMYQAYIALVDNITGEIVEEWGIDEAEDFYFTINIEKSGRYLLLEPFYLTLDSVVRRQVPFLMSFKHGNSILGGGCGSDVEIDITLPKRRTITITKPDGTVIVEKIFEMGKINIKGNIPGAVNIIIKPIIGVIKKIVSIIKRKKKKSSFFNKDETVTISEDISGWYDYTYEDCHEGGSGN